MINSEIPPYHYEENRTIPQQIILDACAYTPPTETVMHNVFYALKEKGKQLEENFASMALHFENIRNACHQFTFKYPIEAADLDRFVKVLQIKAQEAHRFVPDIALSQCLEPEHLGFIRQIEIHNGPTVLEHLLLDEEAHQVIFIEESVTLPNGLELPSSFAAKNSIIEEEGIWYFAGAYLYAERPEENTIRAKDAMFKATHDNMLKFLQYEDVDAIYDQLHKFR